MDGYLGSGYAHPKPEAWRAVEWVAQTEGLPLETTDTGKTMAALLDYAAAHAGARLLFVDTYAEAPKLEEGDWRQLPRRFWPIFALLSGPAAGAGVRGGTRGSAGARD